ncbi:MAG: hypothetical protein ACQETR_09570 [Thermodesulfobacteriota bacterium]
MEAEKKTKTEKMAMSFRLRVILKLKMIVAAVVGCLMVAPLTRGYKMNSEYQNYRGSEFFKTAMS